MSDGPGTSHSARAIDLAAFMHRVRGDRALAGAMAALFLDDSPRQLAAIRAAVTARDAAALEQATHALKGTVANFSADAAAQAALRLELMGRSGDLALSDEALRALETELDRLGPALREIIE